MTKSQKNLVRDGLLIFGSLLLSYILVEQGLVEFILDKTPGWILLEAFIAGVFFSSMFTVAPATVLLAEMMKHESLWLVAIFGGLGALLGDCVIFRFVEDHLDDDIQYLFKNKTFHHISALFRKSIFRFIIPVIGAIIIASPFPDEIGLTMMGLSKMKYSIFIPLVFSLNCLGILTIGLLTQ